MVGIGKRAGVTTVALMTDMSTPLGLTAGNAIEVAESVEVLQGGGPADVVELTLALAREMLAAAGLDGRDPADALADGRAMDVWRAMITAQGGDPDAALPGRQGVRGGPGRRRRSPATAGREAVGIAAWRLGAGRAKQSDAVQAGAGVRLHAKPGDRVRAGEPLLTLYTDTPERFARAQEALAGGSDRQRTRTGPSTADPRPDRLTSTSGTLFVSLFTKS